MLKSRHTALLSLRLRFHDEARIGPGKIALLEALAECGSVAGAGAHMEMSARRAWRLIESLNHAFDEPVVVLADTEQSAGDAQLTSLGREVVSAYRAVEADAQQSLEARFAGVVRRLRPSEAM